eukprot:CAMPEP_0182805864 /NCGR_PEP_ID=MMETSP0006_2-20121128/5293_1 /TAXON_ID=97485 /ORGANISM="Prymnesium parvum, Strain Texoma1" /LENGTH=61 /DNA_ID=CAMNT_0024931441 /DNA_START=121 /DNA_END=306 /DNA_ORIENTATION=+
MQVRTFLGSQTIVLSLQQLPNGCDDHESSTYANLEGAWRKGYPAEGSLLMIAEPHANQSAN